MFWGLIMEPQRRYTQTVKKAFHISMASLDVSTSSEEPAQVMVGFEGRNYLLCTLRKPDLLQCALDLNFEVGDELSLAANGKCHVHLTGYLIEDNNELFDDEEVETDEEEETQEVKKKSKKRNKELELNGPPIKKVKSSKGVQTIGEGDSDEDDSDDSDDDGYPAILEKTIDSEDDDDDTFQSDAEDDGEVEESAEEEEDNDDEVESSLSEAESDEEKVAVSPNPMAKLNGSPKKPEVLTPNKQKEKKDKKNEQKKQQIKELKTEVKTPNKENKSPKPKEAKKILQGGLIIEDLKEGQGQPIKPGKLISVYYEGRLKTTNKVFDSTSKGAGFSFKLGGGEVIKGWDAGLVGMKLGGKRRLTCPPNMAYGPKGSPPTIPGNSTLIFEVELKKIR